MSWDSTTNIGSEDHPRDIVEELENAEANAQRLVTENVMTIPIDHPYEPSLLLRAAAEIRTLRRIVGIVEN